MGDSRGEASHETSVNARDDGLDTLCTRDGAPAPGDVERDRVRAALRQELFGEISPPPRIGRYHILSVLGRGGMGIVYRARDPELDRDVAVKVMSVTSTSGAARLRREAQAMARLSDPHVVQVFEVSEDGGELYVVMELVQGGSLRDWLSTPRTWQEIVDIFVGAGRGLAAAHAADLVHRDFKPENVLVGADGRPRVVDFGLVRAAGSVLTEEDIPVDEPSTRSLGERLTLTGTVMGTPAYLSPEAIKNEAVTPLSDQFSFCVSLYEALYGRRPFEARSFIGLAHRIMETTIPPPPVSSPVPRRLFAILERGLARDPRQRFPSMWDLVAALERERTSPRRRRVAYVLGLSTVALAAFTWTGAARSPSKACGSGPDEGFAAAWNETQRRTVRTAVVAAGMSYGEDTFERIAARLDEHARRWRDARATLCGDADELPAREVDRRWACLEASSRAATKLVHALSEGQPDAVRNAVQAADNLPAPGDCLTEARAWADHDDEAEVRRTLAQAEVLTHLGAFDEARTMIAEVAYLAERRGDVRALALAWTSLGYIAYRRSDLDDAASYYERAHYAAMEADDPRTTGDAALGMARVELARRNLGEQTETWLARARAALLRHGQALGSVLHYEGELFLARGDHQQAEARLQAAVQAHREEGNTRGTASDLQSLARLDLERGRFASARERVLEARALMVGELGDNHPELAVFETTLGGIAQMERQVEPMIEHARRALQLVEGAYPEDHPAVADAIGNMGAVLATAGRFEEAATHFERAIGLTEARFGPRHHELLTMLENLGQLRLIQGETDEAREILERAIVIAEQTVGTDHPQTMHLRENMSRVLTITGLISEAIELLESMSSSISADDRYGSHLRASVHNNLAVAYSERGDYVRATEHAEQALAVWESAEHPNAALTSGAKVNLANMLLDTNEDLGRAESLLLEGLEGFEAAYGSDHPDVADAHLGLARVYLATGNDDAAARHASRAAEVWTAAGYDPAAAAEAQFLHAKAIYARSPARARALARQARATLVERQQDGLVRAIDAWLAKRG